MQSTSNKEQDLIQEAVEYIKAKTNFKPKLGIVLGTGLGKLVNSIKIETEIDYSNIPNFPVATVEFHAGRLIFGTIGETAVVAMQGRFHYYEGYTMREVTRPIRVLKMLGIEYLLLSNAAGGINDGFQKSDLMIIQDHINLLPSNPLIGQNLNSFGPRFPDMSEPYSRSLNRILEEEAHKLNTRVRKGVYVAVSGPMLETAAEYRYLKRIGADAVGMSTVPEVIVARHMNLPCCAISVITDLCNPDNLEPVDIQEIIRAAQIGEENLIPIIENFANRI